MTWLEFIGALARNLHVASTIMGIISTSTCLACIIAYIMTNEEYSEVEFLAISKTSGVIAAFMWILACAPSPESVKAFNDEMIAQKEEIAKSVKAYANETVGDKACGYSSVSEESK